MCRTFKRCEALNFFASGATVHANGAHALEKDGYGTCHDHQERATIRNDPVVAHLSPRFTSVGQARAWVLHKGLNQHARFGVLRFGQAVVTLHTFAHITPERRVVAGLHLGALRIGLVGIAGGIAGVWFDVGNVHALHTQHGGCGGGFVLRAHRQRNRCQQGTQNRRDGS